MFITLMPCYAADAFAVDAALRCLRHFDADAAAFSRDAYAFR